MDTQIGAGLRQLPAIVFLLLGLWTAGFASDVLAAAGYWQLHAYLGYEKLALLVCLVCAFAEASGRWEESPFGLRLTPRQGWWWWVNAALAFGVLLAAILSAFAVLLFVVLDYGVPPAYAYVNEPPRILGIFLWMCIEAPLIEELIHRLALGPPLVALVGPRWTIVIGGLTFAAVHALGGNQSPENLLGGFILMWAFLKSETILVPMALHAAGNACAFAWQVGYFYWNN
ncbi:MAG: lysostaphin resistance A-like protein [Planctomycetaceae bacterium]